MNVEEMAKFSQRFHEDIRTEAHSLEALREEVFVQKMGDILEEVGDVDTMIQSAYKAPGMKVDGYNYDSELNALTLIVSHFLDDSDQKMNTVTNTDIQRGFKHATNFLEKCLRGWHNRMEISSEAYELAQLIFECRDEIRNTKVLLVTDGVAPKKEAETEQINGIEVSKVIWDIERIYNFQAKGEREKIDIDFNRYCNGPLRCISRSASNGSYTTYVGYVPATVLADLYAKWGIRMLDMNVRVFLSARGNVNKGIRNTILEQPEMFCAYNNGITVYAESAEVVPMGDAIGLLAAHDFQIVNGGQTTASLYHTRKKDRASIEDISVQMKMVVIHDKTDTMSMVNRISQYSNTQNKVQLADLAANESPHPELQAISDSILAPDPTGGSRQTYWFYERARGSYEETRNLKAKTPAQRLSFDALRPKSQKFDKLKLGKVWNTYLRMPYLVSLGGQKNFAYFNGWLREQKNEDLVPFFRKTVALLILWNTMEKLARRQKFEGYLHNIVAYSLSWFFYLTDSRIDLEKIWLKQKASGIITDVLESLSVQVNDHIRGTSLNISEYCKKEECWEKLKETNFKLPSNIGEEFISDNGRDDLMPGPTERDSAVEFCTKQGYQAWYDLSTWLRERKFLTPKARSQCYNMGRFLQTNRNLSGPLSMACRKIWDDATIRGWNPLSSNITG